MKSLIFILSIINALKGSTSVIFSLGKKFEMRRLHREFPFLFGRQFGGRFSLEKIIGTETTQSIMACTSVTRKRRGRPHLLHCKERKPVSCEVRYS